MHDGTAAQHFAGRLQAEFNMSLPDMGLLQSAALFGYLLGQVLLPHKEHASVQCMAASWAYYCVLLHSVLKWSTQLVLGTQR